MFAIKLKITNRIVLKEIKSNKLFVWHQERYFLSKVLHITEAQLNRPFSDDIKLQ